jgi:hypothetical protein
VRYSPTRVLNTAFSNIENEYDLVEQDKTDLLDELKSNLDGGANRIFFEITGRSFLDLAESLKVKHPDLDVLRSYY